MNERMERLPVTQEVHTAPRVPSNRLEDLGTSLAKNQISLIIQKYYGQKAWKRKKCNKTFCNRLVVVH